MFLLEDDQVVKPTADVFFLSIAFYNKLQNIGLVGRDQLQRTLKKGKCKYQPFLKNLSTFVPVCHFACNFLCIFVSVNIFVCLYVDLVVLLNVTY